MATDTDDQTARNTLRGMSAITVSVSYRVETESEPPGIRKEQIKNNVELRLREVGIRVVPSEEAVRLKHASAELQVSITCMNHQYVYACHLVTQVVQAMTVVRNDQFTTSPTWSVERYVLLGIERVREIQEHTRDMVDQFLNAYLAMNRR